MKYTTINQFLWDLVIKASITNLNLTDLII